MRIKILVAVIVAFVIAAIVMLSRHTDSFDNKITKLLKNHYSQYHDQEYFSGIAMAVYAPGQEIKSYYVGTVSRATNSKKITRDTLFEIGSITKSFTAAVALQLQKENKLYLTDKLDKWLPEYSKWSSVNIESMLNMTSGLPNYTDAPLWNAEEFSNPQKKWSEHELIQFVYPISTFSPPLRGGYHYTNTGYVLTGMIIEKASGASLKAEIENRLINPARLTDTYYPVPSADKDVMSRLASGYGYNPYANPELVGKDMSTSNLSWAGAAGAIISTPADVVKWVRALFVEDTILDQGQKLKLMTSVSTVTGKPIASASSKDPQAFGLGVIQGFNDKIGKYWFYEGETEGFRALYMYVPETGIIIASAFNSAVDDDNDHAGEFMQAAYMIAKKGVR